MKFQFILIVAIAPLFSQSATEPTRFNERLLELRNTQQPLVNLGRKNYFIETIVSTNWNEGKIFCGALGGMFLASIETQEENDEIASYLRAIGGDRSYWTSGNDMSVPDNFIWDSTGQSVTFTDWAPNEPGQINGGRVIIFTSYSNSYRWAATTTAENSTHPRFVICEEEL